MRGDLAWLTARPVAHRGLHSRLRGIPENTLAAFAAAVRGRFAIELDVRLTRDGEAVVFHDRDLGRSTGADGTVAKTALAAMRRLRVLGSAEYPPSLGEALALIAGRVPVLIELKTEDSSRRLEAAVAKALRSYRGRSAVMAFDPASVAWFRTNAPAIVRGVVSGSLRGASLPAMTAFRARHLKTLATARPDFVAHETLCLGLPAARMWRCSGRPLLAWTVRSHAAYHADRRRFDAAIFEGFVPSD